MSKVRKGFTLVELMIVITIIGIISSMMMISSTQAQNVAKATKIVQGFVSLSSAAVMFYAEDPNSADKLSFDSNAVAKIVAGMKKYIKDDTVLSADLKAGSNGEGSATGVYTVEMLGATWWLKYQLPSKAGELNDLLAARAREFGLKSASNASPKSAKAYDGKTDTVYYCAR